MTKSSPKPTMTPPTIPGFHIVSDSFVKPQGKVQTYRRVRSMENSKTGTKLYIQYRRAHGWLDPMLVTAVGADATGIPSFELSVIGNAFGDVKTKMVEVAFDFSPSSGVDTDFVAKHGLFGRVNRETIQTVPRPIVVRNTAFE